MCPRPKKGFSRCFPPLKWEFWEWSEQWNLGMDGC
jgi:hypothetical protein